MASVRKRTWSYGGEEKTAWVVNYTGAAGKRQMKTFAKKKEADTFRTKIEGEILAGGIAPLASGTVKELAERYLRYQETRLKDGRIGYGRYRYLCSTVDVRTLPYIGHLKLGELSPAAIDEWYLALCRDGLKPSVAKFRIYATKEMVDFAISRGWLKENPVRAALKTLRGVVADPIRVFSRAEVLALLQAVSTRRKGQQEASFQFVRLCVHLAAFCGLRRGEIFGLTRANVDFDRRLLRIRHSLTNFDELKAPKTKSGVRDVPMPHHVVAMMREWVERHATPNSRDLLFRQRVRPARGRTGEIGSAHSGHGNPHCNFHQQHWLRALKAAGLYEKGGDTLHFHALRHFAASFWIENGMSLPDTASLLGHAKFDVTLQTYAHPIVGGNRRHEALDRFAGMLVPPAGGDMDAARARQGELVH